MALLISTIISTLIQIAAVALIGWLVYRFTREQPGFLRFLGLYPAPLKIVIFAAAIGLVSAALLLSSGRVRAVASAPGTVVATLTAHGASGTVVTALVIVALLKTAFAEEVLFRGVIARRLVAWLGFRRGNIAQAAIFGLVHLALVFIARPDMLVVFMLSGFAGALGWFNGWLKERLANGSIVPCIAAHGAANLATYLSLALIFSPAN